MTCPNCGQKFEGNRCPNCGRPAQRLLRRTVAVLLLVFFAVPFSCAGSCFALMGIATIGSSPGPRWTEVATAIGAIVLILGIGIGAFYLFTRLWND